MKIGRVGLVANINKVEIEEVVSEVTSLLPENVEVVGLEETARLSPDGRIGAVQSLSGCDAVISLGGDGTLLMAARLVDKEEIPLLGIKIRSLGFLTEDDPEKAVRMLLSGRFSIQERMRLEISHGDNNGEEVVYTALNDGVIHGVGVSRVLHLETSVGDVMFGEYLADGVIISTPTGSTAYSLAAGGPIINPERMEAFVITPLCPHSLSVRPVVVSGDERLVIQVIEEGNEAMLTVDGQKTRPLEKGEKITIKKSERATRLIVSEEYNFYDLVRRKLKWGGVLRKR